MTYKDHHERKKDFKIKKEWKVADWNLINWQGYKHEFGYRFSEQIVPALFRLVGVKHFLKKNNKKWKSGRAKYGEWFRTRDIRDILREATDLQEWQINPGKFLTRNPSNQIFRRIGKIGRRIIC